MPREFKLREKVMIASIGSGVIINIRPDPRGELVYTIWLDVPETTEDGLYYARSEEMRKLNDAA